MVARARTIERARPEVLRDEPAVVQSVVEHLCLEASVRLVVTHCRRRIAIDRLIGRRKGRRIRAVLMPKIAPEEGIDLAVPGRVGAASWDGPPGTILQPRRGGPGGASRCR